MKNQNKTISSLIYIIPLIGLLIFLNSCNDDDDNPAPENNVNLSEDQQLGSILVDQEGLTLYFFSRDADGTSTCTGGCLDAWPIFYQPEIKPGTGLSSADFGTITHSNGEMQTTYKGWPLYYFAQDQNPGDTNGEGINNIWFVAKPDYTIMISSQPLETGQDPQNYLVNALGNSLYIFTADTENTSNCTGNCLQNWPAFFQDGNIIVPSILAPDDFSVIDRPDQGQQIVYKGMPLYYFVNDAVPGDINGQGINNVWFVQAP